MGWSCGIVGLPNAGKSTLFKAITAHEVTIANYPFSTVDPNKAVVSPEDARLNALAAVCNSHLITPATIEIIDVAGLVKGASRGEGLGNQFLGHLRNVDLLIHVVAAYEAEPLTSESPIERMDTINLELTFADLDTIKRRREKTEPKLKSGEKSARFELEIIQRLEEQLNRGLPLRSLTFSHEEQGFLDQLSLLTLKKMLYVYNHQESAVFKEGTAIFGDQPFVALCGRLEAELIDLPPSEREQYLQAYGLDESMIARLLQRCFELLELITFYTVKGGEARSWVVPRGTRTASAAGKIHTDMEKGFINAEIVNWEQMISAGSISAARDKGLSRTEGKEYLVQDGDVLFIRFRS